jgi:hypothetical protein
MRYNRYLFTTIIKILLGIVIGLALSFVTIVCLEILLPKPNPFRKEAVNLWLVAPIIAGWLFVMLYLMLRKPSSKTIQTAGTKDLPASIAELVDGIIDAMRYRKSIRAEVRQELTDHFTDALADCQDEQERQECIKALIEEFGDSELLGILIRRGKKRCQPVWAKILTHIPHAIGVLILLLIFYVGWFVTGKPQISTNYITVFNQQVRPSVDDNMNAWPYYEQAAHNYVPPKRLNPDTGELIAEDQKEQFPPDQYEKFITLDISPENPHGLSPAERIILDQWLADNRHTMELIRQGNQKPHYWRTYACGDEETAEMISVLLPELNELKRLTQSLCWQAFIEASRGDFNNAFDSTFQAYSLGDHLRGQNTTIIEQLVAISIKAISSQTARRLLNDYGDQIDLETLSDTRRRFQQLLAREDFTVDFESERLFMYDEIQRCFTESRFGKSHLFIPRLQQLTSSDILDNEIELLTKGALHILFTHPDKKQTLETADKLYDLMKQAARQTPAARKTEAIDLEARIESLTKGNFLLQTLSPSLTKVIEISYRSRIDSLSTLATLAILEYHKRNGAWPDSLTTLVENGMIDELPLDPFSHEPLDYHKTGDGFMLYSVGTNFTDDGGLPGTDDDGKPRQWGSNGDWIFWPVPDDD